MSYNFNYKSIVQDSMCLRVAGYCEFSESSWVQAGLHSDSGGMYGDANGTDGHGGWLWSRSSWVQAGLQVDSGGMYGDGIGWLLVKVILSTGRITCL